MFYQVSLAVFILCLGTFLGCSAKQIYVSPRGSNTWGCGSKSHACKSIDHVVGRIAKSHDIINIDGGSGDIIMTEILIIETQFNITFTSYDGKAKIRPQKVGIKPDFFLHIRPSRGTGKPFNVLVTIRELEFHNIALVKIIQAFGHDECHISVRTESCLFQNQNRTTKRDPFTYVYEGEIIWISASYVAIEIKNCTIRGGGQKRGLIAFRSFQVCPLKLYIKIEKCQFYDPSFVIHAALKRCQKIIGQFPYSHFHIKDSIFKASYKQTRQIPLIMTLVHEAHHYIFGRVLIENCHFENIHSDKSAAIFGARGMMYVNVTNSTFVGNSGHWGGALSLEVPFAKIDLCRFVKNRVSTSSECGDASLSGSGGAFVASRLSILIVHNSTFTDNSASCFGDSVYAANCRKILASAVQLGSRSRHGQAYGALWHSFSRYLYLDGFDVRLLSSEKGTQSLFHARYKVIDTGKQKPYFACPVESNIRFKYTKTKSNATSVSCVHCPDKSYSTEYSYGLVRNFKEQDTQLHYIKCQQCPFGANCAKNIVPKSNYWGYKYRSMVHIITCPPGYCCQGADECKQLNSCHGKRKGILCGQCQTGYLKSVFSNECIKKTECNSDIFWAVFFSFAVVLTVIISYLQDIFKLIFRMLNPKGLMLMFQGAFISLKCSARAKEQRELTIEDDEEQDSISESEQADFLSSNAATIENEHEDSKYQATTNSTSGGLIKIVFFYYQVNALLILYKSEIHSRIIHRLYQAMINIFNLQPTHSSLATFGCVHAYLSTILKTLLKSCFPVLMLCVAAVLFTIISVIGYYLRHFSFAKHLRSLNNRLLVAILQIILLGYSTITSNIFSLLTCVTLADGKKILYVDGSITCYQSWQYAALSFIIAWTLPLVYALYAAPKYLRQNALSIRGFYLALLFPLPFLFYSVFKEFILKQETNLHLEEQDADGYYALDAMTTPSTNEQTEREDTRQQLKGQLLNVLGGAFRSHHRKKQSIAWEPVLIAQRLILLCVHTFIVNPVLKAITLLIVIILLAFLNIAVQPFHNKFLNIVNFIFILFLCASGIINSLHAYVYIGGAMIYGPLLDILSAFDYVEIVMILVFPLVAALAYAILLIARLCDMVCAKLLLC